MLKAIKKLHLAVFQEEGEMTMKRKSRNGKSIRRVWTCVLAVLTVLSLLPLAGKVSDGKIGLQEAQAGDSLGPCGEFLMADVGGGTWTLYIRATGGSSSKPIDFYEEEYSPVDGIDNFIWAYDRPIIEAIELGSGVEDLNAYYMFADMPMLEKVRIPKSLKHISPYVFFNCPNIKDVYYDGTAEEWHDLLWSVNSGNEDLINANIHFKETTKLFSDVKDSKSYYYYPVYWALREGITSGTSDTTFSPGDPCTRAQIVTFLWKAQGSPEPSTSKNPFTDVSPSNYYYKAVLWAVENGITTGTSATTFGPKNPCTRAQSMTFLYNAQGKPNYFADISFKDVPSTAYYYNAVRWAVRMGVTAGVKPDEFGSGQTCTRGQIVTFLYNTYVKTY